MAGGVRRERRLKGEESGRRKMGSTSTPFRPGELSFIGYVYELTYLLKAMTGLGYLALTWSTVVLLGGFVTSLQRKDFWCLTAISMMQAARIFHDLGDQLSRMFFNLLIVFHRRAVSIAREWLAFQSIDGRPMLRNKILPTWFRILIIILALVVYMPFLPLLPVCYIIVFLYGYGGPAICIGLALWRLEQRDYGSNDGDASKANLAPALDLFYGLILCQGALYIICLLFFHQGCAFLIVRARQHYKIPRKWGYKWLVDYLFDTREKCWRDPSSIKDSTISRNAVQLIDSESWDDHLSGLRMLATFIRQGANVKSLLLPSRPRIQKLIDALGWRASASREMRKAAACIVAHLAGDINLAQFPGATRCISSLLQDEATLKYWRNCDQQQGRPNPRTGSHSTMYRLIRANEKWFPDVHEQVVHQQGDNDDGQHKEHVVDEEGRDCNDLILQGLTILERLASDHHNCMDISSTPGLLPRIMAPLCSDILIQGVSSSAWADIVNGTFKVLYRLIRCPGFTGETLRWEIAASEQAISNLESILDQSNEAGQELQMRAMEILTQLALDLSVSLPIELKEKLMKKQLEIFLDKESGAISKELKATAGRTLAFLTTNSKENSSIANKDFGRLTEILDAKNNITYRMIAAQILENICAHCGLDKHHLKDTLLPQVLTGIQFNKNKPPQTDEESQRKSAPVNDEENQNNFAQGNDEEDRNISAQGDNAEIQKTSSTTDQNKSSDQGNDEQTATNELQEAFLSLTLVIYDKLNNTDDFDDAVQKKGLGDGEFVVTLKNIVEENCKHLTTTSLRIVKLCGQIAASMMSHNQYTEQFKNQGFVESLSQAEKIMSNLESCILFAGSDPRLKKIARPLLSELYNERSITVG